MSIERDGRRQKIICDECESDLTDWIGPGEFSEAVGGARERGAKIRPDGEGGWSHVCADCRPDDQRPGARLRAARSLFGL